MGRKSCTRSRAKKSLKRESIGQESLGMLPFFGQLEFRRGDVRILEAQSRAGVIDCQVARSPRWRSRRVALGWNDPGRRPDRKPAR
jgi:hypothetical protein